MTNEIKLWRKLQFHDPAVILRKLRALEADIADVDLDARVRRLRTPKLKQYREWRDAAVFTYGLGLAQGHTIVYATLEASDYDFVASWTQGETQYFCPVQLKELPPSDLNPKATLEQVLQNSVKDPRPTSTVLAVKLSQAGRIGFKDIRIPPVPWKQLWIYWSASPDASRWALYGDALGEPGQFEFDYPT